MSVREIEAYTMHAIGAGCFFNNDSQKRIHDPDTGKLRRERIFTSDREIELEDMGVIEFGERFATEIAHVLGWVSPQNYASSTEHATTMEVERDNAVSLQAGAEEASLTNVRQAGQAIERAEDLADQVEELQAKLASANGKLGSLTKQLKDAKELVEQVTDFGDD